MIGIYLITNTITNKNYIGKSIDIERRWKNHISELNLNKHVNIDLQADWNEYGQNNFTFKIIEICSEDVLSNREKHWIDIFNVREYGYNFENRKISKSKWNKDTKNKVLINKLLGLCSFYSKKNVIGLLYFEDVCAYLNISYIQLFNLLTKIHRKDFEKCNIYSRHNWDSDNEYVSFCKWDQDFNVEIKEEYFDMNDINYYIQKQAS